MLKKIILFVLFILSLFFSISVFGERSTGLNHDGTTWDNGTMSREDVEAIQRDLGVTEDGMFGPETQRALDDRYNSSLESEARNAESEARNAESEARNAESEARNAECALSKGCVEKASFTIDVSKLSPGMDNDKLEGSTSKDKVNFLLGIIIQKLMIALGSLSLLIMTVGGGYMIMYHGQDEYLTKGKSIFMGGVIAMIVALSSYYLVDLLRTILY